MTPIQTILHPTDFSESAGHAFRLACSLARDHEARLIVMHVAPPPYPLVGEMVVVPPLATEIEEEERRKLDERLHAMKPSCEGFPIEYRLVIGDAVELILAAAEEVDAGLIVMGTHGRTGLNRLLMGSVAERIVRKAPCSVLTVKAPLAHKPVATPGASRAEEEEIPLMATPY